MYIVLAEGVGKLCTYHGLAINILESHAISKLPFCFYLFSLFESDFVKGFAKSYTVVHLSCVYNAYEFKSIQKLKGFITYLYLFYFRF